MAEIELGEFETGDEVVEGFKNLLQMVATESFKARQPNPEAQRIAEIIAKGDLDKLDIDDVERVFGDAGLYFERGVVRPKEE